MYLRGLTVTKDQIRKAVEKIHKLVNGKTKLDTFAVLERIDKITLDVLTGNGKRETKIKSTGANR